MNKNVDELVDEPSRLVENTKRDASATIGYFNRSEPIANLTGNLPHWRQQSVTYFVTFRLADSLPQEKFQQWLQERKEWLDAHPEPHDEKIRCEYYELFSQRFQKWMDADYGSCLLARPEIKSLVENAMQHFDGERYKLIEFVVMPNHVHVLVTPLGDHILSDILHLWKSYTSHRINRIIGKNGDNWQQESFDHIVRNPDQMKRIIQYIRDNPVDELSVDEPSRLIENTKRDISSTLTKRDASSTSTKRDAYQRSR